MESSAAAPEKGGSSLVSKATPQETAIIYCEGNFGGIDGKTANGLVRHSEKYRILSIIDSEKAGQDAGEVLDGKKNGIAIYRDLGTALAQAERIPNHLIFGIAPATGLLSKEERRVLLRAIAYGINIVNGLHEFLNDDPEFAEAAEKYGVVIRDVRRPRDKKDLRVFSGRIAEVTCPRIAVLGTDCAIGKRTTATVLASALRERGVKTVLIGTGQTGLIQGARYGLALDAVPSLRSEIELIELFAKTKVIGLTINHENMAEGEVSDVIEQYEKEFGIPATDALTRSTGHLVEMVVSAFPKIGGVVST